MIIGIDANEANVDKKVGVSEFAHELLMQFSAMEDSSFKFISYLKKKPNDFMPRETEFYKYRNFGPGKAWTQWRLPLDLYLHKPRPDVFFTPSHYSPRFSPVKTVISVMDLSYIHFPELFNNSDLYQLINWTKYSIKKAESVITISKSSRDDIIKEYGIDENKVHVIYPGVRSFFDLQPHIYAMNELQNKYNISENYILFVGTLQPRKNIERLIEAFSKIPDKKNNLQLVIIGKKGWQYEPILSAPDRFGVKNKVRFLDFVPDEDLKLFYKNAICMVWPSLYEGFGLPVLEAMGNDCPVITSNISSLPEAGGDAAMYVDPNDADDISEKIIQIINNKNIRNKMIEKGKKHVNKFSWEKAAKEILNVLEETALNER